MIVFLIAAAAGAGIAAWLWWSAPTPADRLHAIRRARRPPLRRGVRCPRITIGVPW